MRPTLGARSQTGYQAATRAPRRHRRRAGTRRRRHEPARTGAALVRVAARDRAGARRARSRRASRHSTTLGTDLLYVAVPVASGGVVHGAVRITYPMSAVERARHSLLAHPRGDRGGRPRRRRRCRAAGSRARSRGRSRDVERPRPRRRAGDLRRARPTDEGPAGGALARGELQRDGRGSSTTSSAPGRRSSPTRHTSSARRLPRCGSGSRTSSATSRRRPGDLEARARRGRSPLAPRRRPARARARRRRRRGIPSRSTSTPWSTSGSTPGRPLAAEQRGRSRAGGAARARGPRHPGRARAGARQPARERARCLAGGLGHHRRPERRPALGPSSMSATRARA